MTLHPPPPRQSFSRPPTGPGGGNGGSVAESHVYVDAGGRLRTSSVLVPIGNDGTPSHVRFRCPGGKEFSWRPVPEAARLEQDGRAPFCVQHQRKMAAVPIPGAALFPLSAIAAVLRPYLPPVVVLGLLAVAGGSLVNANPPPHPAAVAALTIAAAWAAARTVRLRLTRKAENKGRVDGGDPDRGKRARALIARRARTAAWAALAGGWWLTLAVAVGVDPHTASGRIVWTLLPVLWLPIAATCWAWIRRGRARPAETVAPDPEADPMEPTEANVRWIWDTRVAVERGQLVPAQPPAGVSGTNGKAG